jgi:TPR repeat protein
MKKDKLLKLSLLLALASALLGIGMFFMIPSKSSTSESQKKPVEFELSKKEDAEMRKWKKRTFDDMVTDALQGDSAGLHMVGECYLYGLLGLPINMERADEFFAVAASIGFPPAINQIRAMYLDRSGPESVENLFLSMVYVNLVASSGHHEYTISYHDVRTRLTEKLGTAIFKEIEQLALKKTLEIEDNKLALKKITNPGERENFIGTLFASGGIIKEDIRYGEDYWESLYSKDNLGKPNQG